MTDVTRSVAVRAEAPGGTDEHLRRPYQELDETERRFRIMADNAPVLLWMAGTDSLCHFFNQQWLNFTGRNMEQEVGTGWAEGVHPEDFQQCMDTYLEAFVARRPFRMEYRLKRADGQFRWLLDHGVPRHAEGGDFAGYIGSCIDVTDLREATETERRIGRKLQVLIQEIHHRVKNNLQLVTSLLHLQSRHLKDPKAIELFRETQGRVRSIALLHEHLYRNDDAGQVDVKEYLGGVIAPLRSALGVGIPIAISLAADGVRLQLDAAIPCGMLVNELVTNSFKHAFREAQKAPTVDVSLSSVEGGAVELVVSDNGAGLPADVDTTHPKTLGLQLVHALSRQLGAQIAVSTGAGTRWTVRIPANAGRRGGNRAD
jgi:PAS domain S-box-containing protein